MSHLGKKKLDKLSYENEPETISQNYSHLQSVLEKMTCLLPKV